MNQHVALEMTSLFGGVIAQFASKWLLTTMNQNMDFQFAWPIACVVSLVALERVFSGVHALVCFKTTSFTTRIGALFTPKWLFPGVLALVCF